MTGDSSKRDESLSADDKQVNEAIEQVLLNIYCPKCQYNLRGLVGREVGCPECGHLCNLTELVTLKWDKPWYQAPGYDKLCAPFYVIVAGPLVMFALICCGGSINEKATFASMPLMPLLAFIVYIGSYIPAYRLFGAFRGVRLAFMIQLIAAGFFLPIPVLVSVIIGLSIALSWNESPIMLSLITIVCLVGCFYSMKYARRCDRYVAQQCIDHYLNHFHD